MFSFTRCGPAARVDGQIDESVKNDRVCRLIELNEPLAKHYASHFEGGILEIIAEEQLKDQAGMLVGYTDNYLKLAIAGDDSLSGKIVKVKITKAGYPLNDGQFVRVMDGVPV